MLYGNVPSLCLLPSLVVGHPQETQELDGAHLVVLPLVETGEQSEDDLLLDVLVEVLGFILEVAVHLLYLPLVLVVPVDGQYLCVCVYAFLWLCLLALLGTGTGSHG